MIKQEENGRWLAKCDICQWKTYEASRLNAENKLSNHIDMKHKKQKITIKKQKPPLPAKDFPPRLPPAIDEH